MRVIAILAAFNEERFIRPCLEHVIGQGLAVYLIDNVSTDGTVAIAERYLGRGLVGIETFPRHGMYSWRPLLSRKEELAATLDADWFVHVDADEFRLPPSTRVTLADALAAVDRDGYNAVNFLEFTFVPTQEAPDHDHPDFQRTMRWYYPLVPPLFPNRLNAWKRQAAPVELAWSGGHQVRFPGLRMYPQPFPMRHYLFLSVPHAIRKYVERRYDPAEVEAGWHRARARLRPEAIRLLGQAELKPYLSDDELDASDPRTQHYLFDDP
jgi:glycosyltransferase involved in cell wall biosynthesis